MTSFIKTQLNGVITTVDLDAAKSINFLATPGFNVTINSNLPVLLPILVTEGKKVLKCK